MFRTGRRWGLVILVFGYLAALGYCLLAQARGWPWQGAWQYFGTWDMYPWSRWDTSRTVIAGETRTGRLVRLWPPQNTTYIEAGQAAPDRLEADRSGQVRTQVFHDLCARFAADPHDPLQQAWLIEEYWPSRWNLPDSALQEVYDEQRPEHPFARVLETWTPEAAR